MPIWTYGAPLQILLQAYLQHQGLQLTHTAAIGDDKKAILLSGKGGQGKSTTTLSCLQEGLNYLGEDYSILQSGPKPTVFSLYHSARWQPHTRTLFPQYEPWIVNKDKTPEEKAQVFYQDVFPKQLRSSLPIGATIALSIGSGEMPLLEMATPEEAIHSLMLSTVRQLLFCGPKTMDLLKKVVIQTPQYKLLLGHNLKANVQLLKKLLETL
jgi:hypothetical protein